VINIQYIKENLIKSSLNYTGGKFKLLEQILPLFPDKIDRFIDLFCGGCNVGINVQANKIICNDNMKPLIDIYKSFQKYTFDQIMKYINDTIHEFNLSRENKEKYLSFRKYYNYEKETLDLYLLTCYSFNNQIRFNSKGEFNMPFGLRQFSEVTKNNLKHFVERIKNFTFYDYDFEQVEILQNDFVYCDPPYLVTTATYNENGGWDETQERKLLNLLDELNKDKVPFALSNVFESKGMSNEILRTWSSQYNVHFLNANYDNCSFRKSDKKSVEVLITNY